MIGMIGVCEELLDGLGPEEPADHCPSAGRGDGKRYCRVNQLLLHMGSSIAGLLRRIVERDRRDGLIWFIWSVSFIGGSAQTSKPNKQEQRARSRASYMAVCRTGGAQKGLEQSSMERVPV